MYHFDYPIQILSGVSYFSTKANFTFSIFGDIIPPKVSSSLAVDLVRSLHKCWNLDTKFVSRTMLVLLQIVNYPIHFAQGEWYPQKKFGS